MLRYAAGADRLALCLRFARIVVCRLLRDIRRRTTASRALQLCTTLRVSHYVVVRAFISMAGSAGARAVAYLAVRLGTMGRDDGTQCSCLRSQCYSTKAHMRRQRA